MPTIIRNFGVISEIQNILNTINKNREQFGEIRKNLAAVVTKIQNWGYTERALREFCDDFKNYEKDIEELKQIMQGYESYLDKKMQKLKELDNINI